VCVNVIDFIFVYLIRENKDTDRERVLEKIVGQIRFLVETL